MPDNIKEDMCNRSVIGQSQFDTFVKGCIQSERVNIWSTMKYLVDQCKVGERVLKGGAD